MTSLAFVDVVGAGLDPTPAAMVAKPTLLLLHGGPGFDHSGFRPFFDRFADTHQVVLYDHRGNGRSDGWDNPSNWNLDRWADDVVALCEALGIERPVVLGQSFGGFVAQLGGSYRYESEGGTRFVMEFPAMAASPAEQGALSWS